MNASRLLPTAQAIIAGTDARALYVGQQYQAFYSCAPDADGLAFWVNALQVGLRDEAFLVSLATSQEAAAKYPDNRAWLVWIYAAILGRAPDAAGLAYWLAQLQAGIPRQPVAAGFTGDEWRRNLVASAFTALLGRAPSSTEAAGWSQQIAARNLTREAFLAEVAAAAECVQHVADDPTRWLVLLYQTYLGRPPDWSGLSFWLKAIDDQPRQTKLPRSHGSGGMFLGAIA